MYYSDTIIVVYLYEYTYSGVLAGGAGVSRPSVVQRVVVYY